MLPLPVVSAVGGVNAGGRSSTLCSYKLSALAALQAADAEQTILELAVLMGLSRQTASGWLQGDGSELDSATCAQKLQAQVVSGSLVRTVDTQLFDPHHLPVNLPVQLDSSEQPVAWSAEFGRYGKHRMLRREDGWERRGGVKLEREQALEQESFYWPQQAPLGVSVAASLPSGFQPEQLYKAYSHPRALQMALFAVSDALNSSGLDWQPLLARLSPNQIAVHAANSIGQLDQQGWGGMLRARLRGEVVHAKQMPLGYPQMCADFINAYVLGSLGSAGATLGACATFLYNLAAGVQAIQHGGKKFVIVGTSDAPISPEIMEGFNSMGALASDDKLQALANKLGQDAIAPAASSRPFGYNCGFVMGESSQFIILMADDFALEVGAPILAAVPCCCTHADGYKKSISAPGAGNYLSLGQACASLEDLLGSASLRTRSFVQAHGTATPVNRRTESEILSQVAEAFGIDSWEVVAAKTFYGHSQGGCAGDQLVHSLGIFAYGILPGIPSIEAVAEDVFQEHLNFRLRPHQAGPERFQGCVLNAKGFGGNNASAALLSAAQTRAFLQQRHGGRAWSAYQAQLEASAERRQDYLPSLLRGENNIHYHVAEDNVLSPSVELNKDSVRVADYPSMEFTRGLYQTIKAQ